MGVDRPLLYMTGDPVTGAASLEAVCPAGCVLVSEDVSRAVGEPQRDKEELLGFGVCRSDRF